MKKVIGIVAIAVVVLFAIPINVSAIDWDFPFGEPQYIVHITETGTMYGPVEKDVYITHPRPPNEDGVVLTADGSGGVFINKADLFGGPYKTPREVCAAAKEIPIKKHAFSFSCSQLWKEEEKLEEAKLEITKLYTSKTEYYPGDTVRVVYQVKNVGTADVDEYHAAYHIIDPSGKTVYKHTSGKHSINVGEKQKWYSEKWHIPDNAVLGTYTVDARVRWFDASVGKYVHSTSAITNNFGVIALGQAIQPSQQQALASPPDRLCEEECKKIFGGRKNVEIIEIGGIYPNCRCVADYRDKSERLIKTEIIEGDKKTIHTFNPYTGEFIRKETISLSEERKKIMKKFGYKYTEEQIDKMLDDKEITAWFNYLMKDIKTETRIWHPWFWWQHFVALLDHGFSGNSAVFVDIYKFGRCGDSMMWLDNQLAKKLNLPTDTTARQQAMISITVEGRILDHAGLLIRPKGISNSEWADIVDTLNTKSSGKKGEGGLDKADIKQLDPRLLNAKVLDPYYKKTCTLEEFIEGWPTIKVS